MANTLREKEKPEKHHDDWAQLREAITKSPHRVLWFLADTYQRSDEPGARAAARILRAVYLAFEFRDPNALKKPGGPRGWAAKYMETRLITRVTDDTGKVRGMFANGLFPERIAFLRQLEEWVRPRLKMSADDLAFWVAPLLYVKADAAGCGPPATDDLDELIRRITKNIMKARESSPFTAERTARAILVGWGMTPTDVDKAYKKA